MRKISLLTSPVMLALSLAMPVSAETLQEALVSAYLNNPQLEAQRASVRATDENINQAASGWGPTIAATGSYSRKTTEGSSVFSPSNKLTTDPRSVQVSIDQPLFRGFQTVNSIREAENAVKAAQGGLADTEQDILLSAVTAFVDVRRDESVVELTRNNVKVLRRQLEASEDRYRVGEITRTDVAQSKARLSRSISERTQAEASLTASRAAYQRIIGAMPGSLSGGATLPPLPKSEQEAIEIAKQESPVLASARYSEEAARNNVNKQYGGLLPQVSLNASYGKAWENFNQSDQTETRQVTAQLTIPLYQAGAQSSRIRQAKQTEYQRRYERIAAERGVKAGVQIAWESLREATARIKSTEAQIHANEIALEGVKQEAEVGARTTLDVLDAEQELLDSRVSNVRAVRDQIVAAYQLLRSVGRLSARNLQLPVAYYDANDDAHRNSYRAYGWGTGDVEAWKASAN